MAQRSLLPKEQSGYNDSGQNQAVGQEGLEINRVYGRQFRPATNGHRRNHTICETAGTAARLVEQSGCQHGIGGQKRFGIREDMSRNGFGGSIQRPAQNSAQAMLLALQSSGTCVQALNFPCAAEPATTVWMRKLVSK